MNKGISENFEKTYQNESDAVFRFCLVRVSNREQALDITQETFLRLWQNMNDSKTIKNERAFLFTIAHNLIIDWYRKKKSVSLDEMMERENNSYDPPDETMLKDILLGTEGKSLLGKIQELNPSYRDPVYLRFVEDLSPKEIGKILGISANTASVRINRGLEELRKKAGYN